jgi:hypothetical protein
MGVELLTERYQDRVAGALSCYDRIIIPGHGARMVLRRGNGQVPAYTAYPDLRLPQVAQPLRDSPRENMERMAAENSLDIEIVRSRTWCAFCLPWSRERQAGDLSPEIRRPFGSRGIMGSRR